MAPYSSTLAWKIPWMEEPGRLQSMRSWRVGHDWATSLSFFTFMHWRRQWQPTLVFLPRESQGWWAAVCEIAQSWTWLKWLSSSSSSSSRNSSWYIKSPICIWIDIVIIVLPSHWYGWKCLCIVNISQMMCLSRIVQETMEPSTES